MKVICIRQDPAESITIGKIYTVSFNLSYYQIENDRGDLWVYPKDLFKPLDEIREEKINKLLS
jgi:hypothetical protein